MPGSISAQEGRKTASIHASFERYSGELGSEME